MPTDFGYFEEKDIGKPYDIRLIKRLYPFTKPYKWLLFCSIILVISITLVELSLPYVTKIAIDRYIVPVQHFDKTVNNKEKTDKTRYLKIDLEDAELNAIVRKYPNQFQRYDSFATISFDALPHLTKKDLSILRKNDIYGLGVVTAVFLAIIIVNFVLNFLQELIMEYSGQMIMHDLRTDLFRHIQNLSIAFFTRNPVGRLVTRVTNDTQNMHELFTSIISFVFKDLFLLAGIAIVLLSINWKLAVVSFTVLPFVLYTSIRFSERARNVFRTLRIKIAEINTKISETLGGIAVIQLFNQERENYKNFEKLNHEYYQAGMQQVQIFAIFMPAIELLGVIAIAIVIYYGGSNVLAGTISLGALVAFISYVKMFFRPIRDIAEKYNILQNAMASAERIFLLFDNKERLPQPAVDWPCALTVQEKIKNIDFKDVTFGYLSNELILKQVNFHIRAGDVTAVVGPTGSGKTTLVHLIPRFYDPTAGQVLINGCNIINIEKSVLRAKIALVTQDPFLFSASIRDNILPHNIHISDQDMEYVLSASNCKSFIEKLPQGLNTILSEGGSSISSGERQLLSIARAFAHNPDLIIFDEATSYIDSETEQKIQEALYNLMKNRTSILVAHRLTTARNADRIIVLNRGRIIETGTHSELMQIKGFYFKLSQLQG